MGKASSKPISTGTENRVRKRYGSQLIPGGGRQRIIEKGDIEMTLNFLQNTQRVTPSATARKRSLD